MIERFRNFRVPASRYELQYKRNGNEVWKFKLSLNIFTSFGAIQNVFEWVEETVEAVI